MSAGIRSGVNCTRLRSRPSTVPSVSTSRVLPRPGTPTSSAWPPASRATSACSTTSSWPKMTRPISRLAALTEAASASTSAIKVSCKRCYSQVSPIMHPSRAGTRLEACTHLKHLGRAVVIASRTQTQCATRQSRPSSLTSDQPGSLYAADAQDAPDQEFGRRHPGSRRLRVHRQGGTVLTPALRNSSEDAGPRDTDRLQTTDRLQSDRTPCGARKRVRMRRHAVPDPARRQLAVPRQPDRPQGAGLPVLECAEARRGGRLLARNARRARPHPGRGHTLAGGRDGVVLRQRTQATPVVSHQRGPGGDCRPASTRYACRTTR